MLMKNYRSIVGCCFLSLVGAAGHLAAVEEERPKPNLVLILADDLGWQDVKCYDLDEPSPYDTPNLDALAKKGVMFWQAYSPAPTCAPSRCAILSGVHPARAQKTHVRGGAPPAPRSIRNPMMDPWYSGRMPEDTFTIARALKADGYYTGHVGKWHIAIDHKAFPQPKDVGFDFTRSARGAHRSMKNRLEGFATSEEGDPFRLDENGFPFHQNNEDALDFIREHKAEPFFLYYATWLVHSPIVTRNEALLRKYEKRMEVSLEDLNTTAVAGQKNPFYGAMVESLDYYVGQVISYLETTDDPRWPGHKLSENTYLIFTSDNGGMEGGRGERYTDNNPLDRGKISAKEGGTRVPLFITGPGIAKGVQSDVMVNGLDFYPTLLSLAGESRPEGKELDGCDLAPLLLKNATDPTLVKNPDGSVRDTMMWHFPHGVALESTLREGNYKLIRNYNHLSEEETPPLELFQLYKDEDGKQMRVDIEEANNLAEAYPKKTEEMNAKLTILLEGMKASYPRYNPNFPGNLPHKDSVPIIKDVTERDGKVSVLCQENGATIDQVQLIYTRNGGDRYEEWFRRIMKPSGEGSYSTRLPKGTTHFFVDVIDENQFLVSYPSLKNFKQNRDDYTKFALSPEVE